MINNTSKFINFIEKVLNNNFDYFSELKTMKTNNLHKMKIKILDDFKIEYKQSHCNLDKIFQEDIQQFIQKFKEGFTLDTNILYDVSKQIEIDYFFEKYNKSKAKLYYSI